MRTRPGAVAGGPEPHHAHGHLQSALHDRSWSGVNLRNTHLSVHIEGSLPSAMVDSGVVYNLIGVHWHMPSEHTVSGRRFPAEVHAVHQNPATGRLMVLGTLVDEGAHAPVWEPIIRALPGLDDQRAPLPGRST